MIGARLGHMVLAMLAVLILSQRSVAAEESSTEEIRMEAVANIVGFSLSKEPRVLNLSTPMLELRAVGFLQPGNDWFAADSGFALLILPEKVIEARMGARFYPWRLSGLKSNILRALYLRPGMHALAVIDGFDLGPDIEIGFAPGTRRVAVLTGLGVAGYLINPRLTIEFRFGVGIRF